jgi:branched-chain amino acid transport system permease protein
MDTLIIQALINGLLLGGVYATFSVGFSLIFGVMGVVNIAHGDLIMIGAFGTFWLFKLLGLDPFITLPITFAVMFGFGYLLQRLIINRVVGAPPIMSYILTFGLHLMITNTALLAFTADPRNVITAYSGANIKLGAGLSVPIVQGLTFILCLGIIYGLTYLLKRTQTGRAIQATAQDREMARLMGVNVRRIFALTFALGAGITAFAGSLIATFRHVEPVMGLPYTILAFCVVVLGGMGHIPGALIGGLVLGVVGSLSSALLTSGWSIVITFSLLYLMLLFRPAGLTGKGIVE